MVWPQKQGKNNQKAARWPFPHCLGGFPCSWWNGACGSKNLDLATCFMFTLQGTVNKNWRIYLSIGIRTMNSSCHISSPFRGSGNVPEKPRRWALQLSIVMSEWLPFEVPQHTLQRREGRNSLQRTSELAGWLTGNVRQNPDSDKHPKRCSVNLKNLETDYLVIFRKGSKKPFAFNLAWIGENIFN